MLAQLRCGHTYAQLAAGFGVGTTTAHRYVAEAVGILAAWAPTLAEAVRTASGKAFVTLDGTLLTVGRIAADRPFRSGRQNLAAHAQTAMLHQPYHQPRPDRSHPAPDMRKPRPEKTQ